MTNLNRRTRHERKVTAVGAAVAEVAPEDEVDEEAVEGVAGAVDSKCLLGRVDFVMLLIQVLAFCCKKICPVMARRDGRNISNISLYGFMKKGNGMRTRDLYSLLP